MKGLENIKAGDKVSVFGRDGLIAVVEVKSATPTLIRTDNTVFRRSDGFKRGNYAYYERRWIESAMPEHIEKARKAKLVQAFTFVREEQWGRLSIEQLESIATMLKEAGVKL